MEIKDVQKKDTLMIRLTTPVDKMPQIMSESFQEVASYMGRMGIAFAGPPYAMYYNMDMEALDVEMGFPIENAHKGKGRVKAGLIPGGRIVTTIHYGPYDRLEESYNKLLDFIQENDLQIHEWMYEYYLNSPMEVNAEELQTRICFVLK